ncbi:hypothetical protein [Sorangium sp. So ce590]|uniref:hypothetical protein n=1 Tax=unclassified Sorangium TaxID=2621164 RepID=UPI003F5E0470
MVDDDDLLLGPSRIDPKRHRAARVGYWGGEPSTDLNEELARSDGPPVCVALPPTPGGLMSLCRICASVVERGRALFVVDLSPDAAGAFKRRGADRFCREKRLDASTCARVIHAEILALDPAPW